MKQVTTKKLEAAHHRWLCKILRISWKDKVTNEKVRAFSQQGKLEDVIREKVMMDGARDANGTEQNCQSSSPLNTTAQFTKTRLTS